MKFLGVNTGKNKASIFDANGTIIASSVTSTELGYVSGVTSAIQTQLNSMLPLSGGTMTGAIYTPNNARGIYLGDDTSIGDVNVANMFGVFGQQDQTVGGIVFGNALDTNLYRGGANLLKTDDTINAVGGFQWNGQSLDSRYLGINANAVSATKLQTARTISLYGDVTGSVSFDGSANASIDVQNTNYNMYVTATDANSNPIHIQYKRGDATLYKDVVSSNPDANNNYQTVVEKEYQADGTTLVKTVTWTIAYDANSNITSKTFA